MIRHDDLVYRFPRNPGVWLTFFLLLMFGMASSFAQAPNILMELSYPKQRNVTGNRNIVIVLIQDNTPGRTPLNTSPAQALSRLQRIDQFYRATSKGQFSITPMDVIGPINGPFFGPGEGDIYARIRGAIERSGFNPARYDLNRDGTVQNDELGIMVLTNSDPGGQANPAVNCSQVSGVPWCFNIPTASDRSPDQIIAHEMGHSLLDVLDLYGHHQSVGYTIMSYPTDSFVHFDPWNKIRLGWENNVQIVDLSSTVASGRLNSLNPASGNSSNVWVIVDSQRRGYAEYFILEYRKRSEFDGVPEPGLVIWRVIPYEGGLGIARASVLGKPDLSEGSPKAWKPGDRTPMLHWFNGEPTGIRIQVNPSDNPDPPTLGFSLHHEPQAPLAPNLTPVYRWVSPVTGDYISFAQHELPDAQLYQFGYRGKALQFYAYEDRPTNCGSYLTVSRFISPRTWTPSPGGPTREFESFSEREVVGPGYTGRVFQFYAHVNRPANVLPLAVHKVKRSSTPLFFTYNDFDRSDIQRGGFPGFGNVGYFGVQKPPNRSPFMLVYSYNRYTPDRRNIRDHELFTEEDFSESDALEQDPLQVNLRRLSFYGLKDMVSIPGEYVKVNRWKKQTDDRWITFSENQFTDAQLTAQGYTRKLFQYYAFARPPSMSGLSYVPVYQWTASNGDLVSVADDAKPSANMESWGYRNPRLQFYALRDIPAGAHWWTRIPVQQDPTISSLEVTFTTGGDDLRGGAVVYGTVSLRDGRTLQRLNLNRGVGWGNNSVNTVSIPLPAGIRIRDLGGFTLEQDGSGRNFGEDYNNWDVAGISVAVRSPRLNCSMLLVNRTGVPLVRLTGQNTQHEVRLDGR